MYSIIGNIKILHVPHSIPVTTNLSCQKVKANFMSSDLELKDQPIGPVLLVKKCKVGPPKHRKNHRKTMGNHRKTMEKP